MSFNTEVNSFGGSFNYTLNLTPKSLINTIRNFKIYVIKFQFLVILSGNKNVRKTRVELIKIVNENEISSSEEEG